MQRALKRFTLQPGRRQKKRPRLPDKFSAYTNQADIQGNCQQRRYPDKEKSSVLVTALWKAGPRKACGSVIPSHKPRIVQAVREGVEDALNQRDHVKRSDSAQAGQQHSVLCPWMKSRFHNMPPRVGKWCGRAFSANRYSEKPASNYIVLRICLLCRWPLWFITTSALNQFVLIKSGWIAAVTSLMLRCLGSG